MKESISNYQENKPHCEQTALVSVMDEITAPADCLYTGYTKRKQSVPKTMTSLNTNINRIRNLNSAIKIVRKLTGIKYHYTSARWL